MHLVFRFSRIAVLKINFCSVLNVLLENRRHKKGDGG